uniref:Uncharacterized protein n=1 Tax=Panagrolaimus sp. JU765 TaxID=591449 RepID=A0AC34R2H8_9BILA
MMSVNQRRNSSNGISFSGRNMVSASGGGNEAAGQFALVNVTAGIGNFGMLFPQNFQNLHPFPVFPIGGRYGVETHRKYAEIFLGQNSINFVFFNGERIRADDVRTLAEILDTYKDSKHLQVHAVPGANNGEHERAFLDGFYNLWRRSVERVEEIVFVGQWEASTITAFCDTLPMASSIALLDCALMGDRARLKSVIRACANAGVAPQYVFADTRSFFRNDFAEGCSSALQYGAGFLKHLRLILQRMPTYGIFKRFQAVRLFLKICIF